MGFVTFILLTNFKYGKQDSKFDPDLMMYIYSKSLILWGLEAVVEKGVFYLFNLGYARFFEMVAISGYKFIIISAVVICDVLLGF